jgi:hypothetical protein
MLKGCYLDTVEGLSSRMPKKLLSSRSQLPRQERMVQPRPSLGNMSDLETAKAILISLYIVNDGPENLKDEKGGLIFRQVFQRIFAPAFLKINSFPLLLSRLLSSNGSKLMKKSQPSLLQWFEENQDFNLGTRNLGPINSWNWIAKDRKLQQAAVPLIQVLFRKRQDWDLQELINHVASVLRSGMRLMVTKKGSIGMAHAQARRGDHIVHIENCSMPAVLRKYKGGYYLVVGEAYIYPPRKWEEIWMEEQENITEFSIL